MSPEDGKREDKTLRLCLLIIAIGVMVSVIISAWPCRADSTVTRSAQIDSILAHVRFDSGRIIIDCPISVRLSSKTKDGGPCVELIAPDYHLWREYDLDSVLYSEKYSYGVFTTTDSSAYIADTANPGYGIYAKSVPTTIKEPFDSMLTPQQYKYDYWVFHDDGKPWAGAYVSVHDTDATTSYAVALTNNDGYATFYLEAGVYEVLHSCDGDQLTRFDRITVPDSGWRMVGNRIVGPSLNDRFQRAWDSLSVKEWYWLDWFDHCRMPTAMNLPRYMWSVKFPNHYHSEWWDSLAVLKNDPHWRDSLKVRKP